MAGSIKSLKMKKKSDIRRQISFMYGIFINIDQCRSLVYITIYLYSTVFGVCTSFSFKVNSLSVWINEYIIWIPDPRQLEVSIGSMLRGGGIQSDV